MAVVSSQTHRTTSTKLPPRQQTHAVSSLPELSGQENFARFLSFFNAFGPVVSFYDARCPSVREFHFDVRLTHTFVGEVIWARIDRCAFVVRSHQTNGEAMVRLMMCASGRIIVNVDGTTQILKPGMFLADDPERPTGITFTEPTECVILVVKADYFHTHSGFHSPNFMRLVFAGETVTQRFFARHLLAMVRDVGNIDARDVANVCDAILCLCRSVLLEFNRATVYKSSTRRTADELYSATLEVMQHRYKRSDLGVADIAAELGVSARYLSKTFSDRGTTVMHALYDMRLRRAAVQLYEEHFRTQSVSEISSFNGFASVTHFGRLFKKKYGVTPLQWRRMHV